jgi:hypothetical protein
VLSESSVVKKMVNSSFLHHDTAIPARISEFWVDSELQNINKKYIEVIYQDEIYLMYIIKDSSNRLRLFWDAKFNHIIQEKFNEIYSIMNVVKNQKIHQK